MAAGRVITGFSKPYVAKLSEGSGGIYTYNSGMLLARGVNVSISPDTGDDNSFHADNTQAETDEGSFTGGELALTVDGLFPDAERLIMGLPAASGGWTTYNNNQSIPFVGVGFIVRYQSGGVVTYVPMVIAKCRFNQIGTSAATQEENVDYQTQELSAKIFKIGNSRWKNVHEEVSTEAAEEALLKSWFYILDEE